MGAFEGTQENQPQDFGDLLHRPEFYLRAASSRLITKLVLASVSCFKKIQPSLKAGNYDTTKKTEKLCQGSWFPKGRMAPAEQGLGSLGT